MRVRVLSILPKYAITEDGRIYGPRGWLNPSANPISGYLHITTGPAGAPKRWLVHRLVALAYLGDPPSAQHEVAHLNGNSRDNRIENLAWKTHAENEADKAMHGTKRCGERHGSAKLTDAEADEIRAEYKNGVLSHVMLAEVYGVASSTITRIINGNAYRPEQRNEGR
ncbi:HNH endonuclease [Streptomyces sp. NPDC059009]|uniref:HNH endonuclease n=1 Tax=Streptomyces sp. NPDC059009 TaxID=3346694 RepID=UPI0036CDE642